MSATNTKPQHQSAPHTHRKKRRKKRSASGLFIRLMLILILILACLFGYKFCYMIFDTSAVSESADDAAEATIRIDSTMSALDVGNALESAGLIDNAGVFAAQFKFFSSSDIVPGSYLLNSSMTADEIIETITTEEDGSDS